jgi:hypothetical protein
MLAVKIARGVAAASGQPGEAVLAADPGTSRVIYGSQPACPIPAADPVAEERLKMAAIPGATKPSERHLTG